eukprot:COSAG02_NODE_2006_length_10124_cov_6.398664_10_plen_246_part_00
MSSGESWSLLSVLFLRSRASGEACARTGPRGTRTRCIDCRPRTGTEVGRDPSFDQFTVPEFLHVQGNSWTCLGVHARSDGVSQTVWRFTGRLRVGIIQCWDVEKSWRRATHPWINATRYSRSRGDSETLSLPVSRYSMRVGTSTIIDLVVTAHRPQIDRRPKKRLAGSACARARVPPRRAVPRSCMVEDRSMLWLLVRERDATRETECVPASAMPAADARLHQCRTERWGAPALRERDSSQTQTA